MRGLHRDPKGETVFRKTTMSATGMAMGNMPMMNDHSTLSLKNRIKDLEMELEETKVKIGLSSTYKYLPAL